MSRHRQLSDAALRILRACAAAAAPVPAPALLPLVGGSAASLIDAVGVLQGRMLLRRSGDLVSATRHGRDLLRTAVYRARS